ncbi:MAG: quinol oxidase [Nitrospirae bacterium GWC2_46_6]|nr:MAG: quinol oxidase [Nitrospirae bacterium GWA2_46_11]OGW21424.1 MAG: quinol oxidase [Nitrospirae bacterium GWC2_46_6]OGW24614.1 MAG: quinol oxidase [Nitrospirae bacterium GWB2_47_37]HAK89165.1 quinol oxidase [Nitrospiraceae bacterium]HCL81727.1 quinol oxidase [Nitrospiraceae bacterium]
MRNFTKFLAIIFIIAAGTAFAQDSDKHSGKKVYKAFAEPDGLQRVNIVSGEYFFDPDHIIVKVGLPVEIHIKKEAGITPHNIIINAPEAGIEVRENLSTEPVIIKFTPKKTGKYPFYCDKKLLFFKSHKERGMEGIIEVIE